MWDDRLKEKKLPAKQIGEGWKGEGLNSNSTMNRVENVEHELVFRVPETKLFFYRLFTSKVCGKMQNIPGSARRRFPKGADFATLEEKKIRASSVAGIIGRCISWTTMQTTGFFTRVPHFGIDPGILGIT